MKGAEYIIAGKKYNLVFNNIALQEVTRKFGGVEELADKMKANPADSMDIVFGMVALMANQGTIIETHNISKNNPDLITAEYVGTFTKPSEITALSDAMTLAVKLGLETEHQDSGTVDLVLEELRAEERKNAVSGEAV